MESLSTNVATLTGKKEAGEIDATNGILDAYNSGLNKIISEIRT